MNVGEFPDGEAVVMALLEQIAPTVQTTPEDFAAPLIQVIQTGGTRDQLNTRPVLEVAYFGENYAHAMEMASQGDEIVLASKGKSVLNVPGHPNGVLIDRTEILVVSREVAYLDRTAKRRKTASYRLTMRRSR